MSDNEHDDQSRGENPPLVKQFFGTKFAWPIVLVVGILLLALAIHGHETYLGDNSWLLGLLGVFLVFTGFTIGLDYFVGTLFGKRKTEVETGKPQKESVPQGCAVALLILVSGIILIGVGAAVQESTALPAAGTLTFVIGILAVLYSFHHAAQAIFDNVMDSSASFLGKFKYGWVVSYAFWGLVALLFAYGAYLNYTDQ